MKPKFLLFLSPLVLFLEFYLFSWMCDLLTQPNDIAVLVGVVIACGFVIGNYFLIRYIVLTIKNKLK